MQTIVDALHDRFSGPGVQLELMREKAVRFSTHMRFRSRGSYECDRPSSLRSVAVSDTASVPDPTGRSDMACTFVANL